MKHAHTPGPWVWNESQHYLRPANPDPGRYAVHTILDVDRGGVGFLGSDHAATRRELATDYKLIEAAPLLYEALRRAWMYVRMDSQQSREYLREVDALLDAIDTGPPPPGKSDTTPAR